MLLVDSAGTKYAPLVLANSRASAIAETAAENPEKRQGFGTFVWKEVTEIEQRYDIKMYGNTMGWWNAELQ